MNKYLLKLTILTLIIQSCGSAEVLEVEEKQDPVKARKDLFSKIYNENNLTKQSFTISGSRDTFLVSSNKTVIRIYSKSFLNKNKDTVVNDIEIEFKEAITLKDIVASNLTTTSDSNFLESGGMIYINAKSGKENLILADGKEIGFSVKTDSVLNGMQIYQGEKTENGMNWVEPEPVLNEELRMLEESYCTVWFYDYYHSPKGKRVENEDITADEHTILNNWFFNSGSKIGDTLDMGRFFVFITNFTRNTVKMKEEASGLFAQEVVVDKGINGYIEDYNTNYIFNVKDLGWANIDRLFDDPRSTEVEMIVQVENQDEFGYVFTSLILPGKKMFIGGYQRKDHCFGFTHDDNEKPILPIGEEAVIMATAYKDGKPFFSIQRINIKDKNKLSFALLETTKEELMDKLEKEI